MLINTVNTNTNKSSSQACSSIEFNKNIYTYHFYHLKNSYNKMLPQFICKLSTFDGITSQGQQGHLFIHICMYLYIWMTKQEVKKISFYKENTK